jgi:hypothetical protein
LSESEELVFASELDLSTQYLIRSELVCFWFHTYLDVGLGRGVENFR